LKSASVYVEFLGAGGGGDILECGKGIDDSSGERMFGDETVGYVEDCYGGGEVHEVFADVGFYVEIS
jgi:hypothetical protein